MDDESTIRRLFDQKIAREATNPTPTQPETLPIRDEAVRLCLAMGLPDNHACIRLAENYLRSRAAVTAPRGDWQLIETAPKDGTRILLACGDYVWLDEWWKGNGTNGGWSSCVAWEQGTGKHAEPPTHWMPLPNSPTTAATSSPVPAERKFKYDQIDLAGLAEVFEEDDRYQALPLKWFVKPSPPRGYYIYEGSTESDEREAVVYVDAWSIADTIAEKHNARLATPAPADNDAESSSPICVCPITPSERCPIHAALVAKEDR